MGISFLNSKNFINNYTNVKNINKIKNNCKNTLSFKGGSTDTVEFSANANTINEINKKIQSEKEKKAELAAEYKATREEYETLHEEFRRASSEYGNNDKRTKELLERVLKTKQGDAIKAQINKTDAYIKKLEKYLEAMKTAPDTAFLYNPDTTIEEKENQAQKISHIKSAGELAETFNIPPAALNYWSKADAIDTAYAQDDKGNDAIMYIDLNNEKNSEFFNSIKDKLKTSLSGEEVNKRYTIAPATMRRALNDGRLKALGTDTVPEKIKPEYAMYDMKDETNKRYFRSKTYHDRRYFGAIGKPGSFIPAAYLEKMGYATVPLIRKNIQERCLPGKIEVVETPEGKKYKTMLDVSNYLTTKDFLKIARGLNRDVVSIQDLAKELGVKQGRIKHAIEEGEAEIINEYLITEEKGKIYLKRSNPKNALFIEKALFEKMIAEELRAKEKEEKQQANIKRLQGLSKENSLRMKLARHMCPNTREIASKLAKQDAHLCQLLIKDNDSEKELTPKEEIKVNSYRKKMWSIAGTEELSAALKKAQEYMNAYYEGGIKAIDDEEIKEIIKMYYPG